jgi:hypothetical protein
MIRLLVPISYFTANASSAVFSSSFVTNIFSAGMPFETEYSFSISPTVFFALSQ